MNASASGPLKDMRIVITRPAGRGEALARRIRELGGVPIVFPTIEVLPLSDHSSLDEALSRIERYGWVVFTSASGVRAFFGRASDLGVKIPSVGCKFAVIGPGTAGELARHGAMHSFMPSEYLTKALAEELPIDDGERVLLVRAEGVGPEMADILSKKGAVIEEVYAYRVRTPRGVLRIGDFDAVIFSSPSSVRGFLRLIEGRAGDVSRAAKVWCIGPVTAKEAISLGLKVDAVAEEHTVEGIIKAIERGGV
jgi:uroporphyrinogen-III synthase